jgi:hypothetical protein
MVLPSSRRRKPPGDLCLHAGDRLVGPAIAEWFDSVAAVCIAEK